MRPKRKAAAAADEQRKKAKTGDTHSITKFNLDWHMEGKRDNNDIGTLMVLDGEQPGRTKVIGFDIDYTIIKTHSGRKFATGANDWEWLYPCIPDKLRSLDKDGYRVVFFTNQAGIEKQKVKPTELITKINNMVEEIDIPIISFASTGQNEFRKPSTNMWDYFVKNSNGGVAVELAQCMYVGDAAGRAKDWQPGKPKDFSCSDRMFAANIGIGFQTPEEFFLDEPHADFSWRSLDPVKYLESLPSTSTSSSKHKEPYHSKEQEMIIMIGPPASGKSTFSNKYLVPHGYVRVNRDTLKTQEKCLKAARAALADGKSVVVDNTNPSAYVRADYIDAAKDEEVPVRCFVMKTPLELAHHLNLSRQIQTNGAVRRVPDVGYNMYKKNYVDPELAEGFSEIKEINFQPKFDSKRDEEIFKQWTTAGH